MFALDNTIFFIWIQIASEKHFRTNIFVAKIGYEGINKGKH